MPKERIYDLCEQFDMEIGWSSGSDVQIGVESHDGKALQEVLGDAGFAGVWGSYDREGINKLIRVLRRARDQAFGRDE